MVRFVESGDYCDNHPSWSSAFASRLRDSITDSNILGYLATELGTEHNCAKFWAEIEAKLSSSDVKTARIYED